MTDLLLTFVGGALGSSHCLGMCGPFALSIGAAASGWRGNLGRQLVYSAGRIFTYTFAGAAAGLGALKLTRGLPATVPLQGLLSLVAGLFLLYEGLRVLGLWPRRTSASALTCVAGKFFGPLLRGHRLDQVFLAGVFTGFLPCGLVYAFVALAGATESLTGGAARMALFGLGTTPLMVVAGVGGQALGMAARKQVFRLAGVCVLLSGAVSVVRGVSFLLVLTGASHGGCPLCH